MKTPLQWAELGARIARKSGRLGPARPLGPVAGGDINQALRIEQGGECYFLKLNDAERSDMFEAEALGLAEIREAGALRCPAPVVWGRIGGHAFLVLEFLELRGRGHGTALGEGLAQLHGHTAERHGWHRDNTIGATPQQNDENDDWVSFWREHRLGYQLELASRRGHAGMLQELGARLLDTFAQLFESYTPRASLLHGDLWGGNYAYLPDGEPVVFDPAVYYGDRETDLAMTELFGGFGDDFYSAYRAHWPLDPGYAARRGLYQLYHVLNHLNLFGGGYRRRAEHLMQALLAELGH